MTAPAPAAGGGSLNERIGGGSLSERSESKGPAFSVTGLLGIPEIRPGDDLGALLARAYVAHGPADGDILVVTSKVVSKAEGRIVEATERDVVVDAETVRVVATVEHAGGRTRIVENPQGLILAAAGVDASNAADGEVLLLPIDPDASARALAAVIRAETGARVGVVLSDTLGRAWRVGQIDQAIGAAGVRVVDDLRGSTDSGGRVLEATIAALGDEIASAAELVKGKTSGIPVAVVRGLGRLVTDSLEEQTAAELQRPAREDLFRLGAAEAWREGYQAALAAATRGSSAGAPTRGSSAGAPTRGSSGGEAAVSRPPADWTLVIPVKPAASGKSRLDVPGVDRIGLARAIALDTVEAAAACLAVARVLVVTADPETANAVRTIDGVDVVADTSDSLRAAIALGLDTAGEGTDRAVLLGDLPALDPVELAHALALASSAGRTFVPDADGVGSSLATARARLPFAPRFGADSAAAHRAAGFAELVLPPDWGLRRDVDTREHLDEAAARGALGPRTAALLGHSG
ncbi:MAG TPA: coenzyme F420-0:L-glutamate ligase [Microbacteriaceae bacterium]|nr:coenzyme F420-0:L-glutamate ligase [Microbacteriaceae bacterium]